jgi:hypothetical protein
MRTPLEIIAELKHVTYWSQPNIKFGETMALINELETALTVEEIVENPIEFTEPTKEEIEFFDAALEDFLEIEDTVLDNLTEEETAQLTPEIKPPVKKTPAKPKAKK